MLLKHKHFQITYFLFIRFMNLAPSLQTKNMIISQQIWVGKKRVTNIAQLQELLPFFLGPQIIFLRHNISLEQSSCAYSSCQLFTLFQSILTKLICLKLLICNLLICNLYCSLIVYLIVLCVRLRSTNVFIIIIIVNCIIILVSNTYCSSGIVLLKMAKKELM